jgi:putative glutamine transport system permease protein
MSETLAGSFRIIADPGVLKYLISGVAFTLIIAGCAIVLSIVFGSVLALCRNYCNDGVSRIFKYASIAYIEIFRNTPLMLWMFVGLVFFKVPEVPQFFMSLIKLLAPSASGVEAKNLIKMMIALTLFTSSVMAEVIRGGLNAVPKGQFEAGYTQGFGTVKVMTKLVLPQAYRKIVPTLLGLMITTIKDSSYIATAGLYFEFMARIKVIICKANEYNGTWVDAMNRGTINVTDVFVLFGFAFLIYFAINFILSCAVRRFTKKKEAC